MPVTCGLPAVEKPGGGVPVGDVGGMGRKISVKICPRPAGENIILQTTSLYTDRPPTIGGPALRTGPTMG